MCVKCSVEQGLREGERPSCCHRQSINALALALPSLALHISSAATWLLLVLTAHIVAAAPVPALSYW